MKTKTFKSEYIEGSTVKVTAFRDTVKFEFGSGFVMELLYFTPRDLSSIEMKLECDFMSYYYADKITNWIKG